MIIPHYNSVNFLYRLLDSIPGRSDIQVVVVDDLSDQVYFEQLESEARNVTFYQLPKKGYAGAARNFGISVAVGEYILFADSDDIFASNAFAIFDESITSNTDLIVFGTKSFIEGKGGRGTRDDYRNRGLLNTPIRAALRAVPPWAKLVRKGLIEEYDLYFSEVVAANDVVFSTKLSCVATEILVIKKVVYLISQGAHNLSADMALDKSLSRLQEQRKKFSIIRKYRPVPIFEYCLSHSLLISFMQHSERLQSHVYDDELRKYQKDLSWAVVSILRVQKFLSPVVLIRFRNGKIRFLRGDSGMPSQNLFLSSLRCIVTIAVRCRKYFK